MGEIDAAAPVNDAARQDKACGNVDPDRISMRSLLAKPVCNGAQGGRISFDDRHACFVCQPSKWPVGDLRQLRIAKPEYCRLVEAREHIREGATVLRPSSGQKLRDSRSVAEGCFLRSFAIR